MAKTYVLVDGYMVSNAEAALWRIRQRQQEEILRLLDQQRPVKEINARFGYVTVWAKECYL